MRRVLLFAACLAPSLAERSPRRRPLACPSLLRPRPPFRFSLSGCTACSSSLYLSLPSAFALRVLPSCRRREHTSMQRARRSRKGSESQKARIERLVAPWLSRAAFASGPYTWASVASQQARARVRRNSDQGQGKARRRRRDGRASSRLQADTSRKSTRRGFTCSERVSGKVLEREGELESAKRREEVALPLEPAPRSRLLRARIDLLKSPSWTPSRAHVPSAYRIAQVDPGCAALCLRRLHFLSVEPGRRA